MLDLFSDTPPWQEPLAPARWCCGDLPANAPRAAAGDSRRRQSVAVSPDGHAGRVHHVGRHDQLRRAGLDYRSPRLFVRPGRPVTDQTSPPMPAVFHELALAAAAAGGYPEFSPTPV